MKDPTLDIARRILDELAEAAEHASLTGSMRGGERSAAQTYNRVLATFERQGILPDGMFEPIDESNVEYGHLGIQCRLLRAATHQKKEERRREGMESVVALAPFLDSADLSRLVRERMGEGTLPDGLLVARAPFLDSHTLGDLVRRSLHPEPPAAPTPPAPSAPPDPPADLLPVVQADLPTDIDGLIAELRRPNLDSDERKRIATRLMEMTHEL